MSTIKNYTKRFVIYAYALFWVSLLFSGGIVQLFEGNLWVMQCVVIVCSWTPTVILLILFKKIFPNCTVIGFYKKVFSQKISFHFLIVVTIIQTLIFIASVCIVAFQKSVSFITLLDYSIPTIISGFFFTLLQGATGEESGWRGFLQPAIEKKSGVIMGSVIVGAIWAFWHTPLWFVSSGYTGIELVKYIVVFVVCIISFAVIVGICYNHCKNLFVPIWMHFVFNFVLVTFIGSAVDIMVWLSVFYFITALGFVLWHKIKISRNEHKKYLGLYTGAE